MAMAWSMEPRGQASSQRRLQIRPQMAGFVDEGTVEYIEADFLNHAADMVEKL